MNSSVPEVLESAGAQHLVRTRRKTLWLVTTVVLILITQGWTLNPLSYARARIALESAFPGFHVVKWTREDTLPAFFGMSASSYRYRLESDRVRGFELSGRYYLRHTPETIAKQRTYLRTNMFNDGALSESQLTSLERLYVRLERTRQQRTETMPVSAASDTGAFVPGAEPDDWSLRLAHPVDPKGLYRLDALGSHFFRWDAESTRWTYERELTQPGYRLGAGG